jgi:hypothetical protein
MIQIRRIIRLSSQVRYKRKLMFVTPMLAYSIRRRAIYSSSD